MNLTWRHWLCIPAADIFIMRSLRQIHKMEAKLGIVSVHQFVRPYSLCPKRLYGFSRNLELVVKVVGRI